MVKIKSGMSTECSGGESEALATVRSKLKVQQRLIDISARSLLSSRSSSADLSQSFESQSALEVQRENISVQEVCVTVCMMSAHLFRGAPRRELIFIVERQMCRSPR